MRFNRNNQPKREFVWLKSASIGPVYLGEIMLVHIKDTAGERNDWKSNRGSYSNTDMIQVWSGVRESNPRLQLGRLGSYHYTNAAIRNVR